MKELLEYDKSKLIETLWEYDPKFSRFSNQAINCRKHGTVFLIT